jgi:hypothetical protein
MNTKIDISSTALEKGLDIAKNFLDKLIGPTIEETGLLLKDKVTLWKFKNQIKILNKAKAYCEKQNITTKAISLKLMCPLLDYAALEEEETLQDKWAILISNMVDSEQNIENHVFPYLLSQLSSQEFMLLDSVVQMKKHRISELNKKLGAFIQFKTSEEAPIKPQIIELEKEIQETKKEKSGIKNVWDLQREKWDLEKALKNLKDEERKINVEINTPEFIPAGEIKEYEISNILRLGLGKSIYRPYAYVDSHRITNDPHSEYLELQDLEIHIENEDDEYVLTELGELFINACNEKKTVHNKM